jgi:anthranilate/para-aminobenzoate synthase component II
LQATRYHSLSIEEEGWPEALEITARSDDEVVMGVAHKELPVEGVQFHPESIMTPDGMKMLQNFLANARLQQRAPAGGGSV